MDKPISTYCLCCGRKPADIKEYIVEAEVEGVSPDEFVWENEGTLNHVTGCFFCTECYIERGQPLGTPPDHAYAMLTPCTKPKESTK